MLFFLEKAHSKGVSMNNLSYRKPTHIYQSDASFHGIGSYNILFGKAWRFKIPRDCRLRTSLNSLEIIAALITIWMDFLNDSLPSKSCLLSQTDGMSAAGLLKKSNFSDSSDEIVQLTTARKLASMIIDSDCCMYSQWFPGEQNDVSDACSRYFYLSDYELTELILTSVPHQVPLCFKIYQLPNKITSWLICLLLKQPQEMQWNQEPLRSKLSLGKGTRR